MKRLLTLTFISICMALAHLSAAEVPSRDAVLRMVDAGQFDRLEKLTRDLRAQKLEFYHGYSELSKVYGYLDDLSKDADDVEWEEFIAKLQAWADAYPQSPAPRIALGKCYVTWAWKARGGGYANTVTDEGWRLMKDRLVLARKHLEAAEKFPVQDPEVYVTLLHVALGQSWSKDEMNEVFQKGIKLEPNCQQLYEAKAYFLLPRWHGEPGDWEAFAAEAADARGGVEGDILYMSIARSQAWSERENFFRNTSISYERMQRGFKASLERHPDYLWDMNSYCYFACIDNEHDTAKGLFEKINGRWERGVWRNQNYFNQWEQWGLRDGARPATAQPAAAVVSSWNWKSLFILLAGIWVGLLTIIFVIIWLVVRKPGKT